jgi:hypothetical protein
MMNKNADPTNEKTKKSNKNGTETKKGNPWKSERKRPGKSALAVLGELAILSVGQLLSIKAGKDGETSLAQQTANALKVNLLAYDEELFVTMVESGQIFVMQGLRVDVIKDGVFQATEIDMICRSKTEEGLHARSSKLSGKLDTTSAKGNIGRLLEAVEALEARGIRIETVKIISLTANDLNSFRRLMPSIPEKYLDIVSTFFHTCGINEASLDPKFFRYFREQAYHLFPVVIADAYLSGRQNVEKHYFFASENDRSKELRKLDQQIINLNNALKALARNPVLFDGVGGESFEKEEIQREAVAEAKRSARALSLSKRKKIEMDYSINRRPTRI